MEHNLSPMSETAYYILLSLLEERHGYGIMQYVAGITANRINIGAGTIDGTLGKLEKSKMITTTRDEEKRKYYQITEEGIKMLEAEIKRLEELYSNGREALSHGK